LGYSSDNSFIVHSGIDESTIINLQKLQEKAKRKSKTIFIASSMIKQKNIDILIKSFAKVAEEKNVKLKIAVDGTERKNLYRLVREKNLEDKVEFLGYMSREKVFKQMEEADVFVMVSSNETFGLVYLEAMAKGCITIGSKGEGIDGVIKDSENGYLS